MPRYLGIDHGTKRIGLAVGDADTGIASPIESVETGGDSAHQAQAVLDAARAYAVDVFVVGLPVNMDDTEGRQVGVTRRFGDELARISGKPVRYWDERLSSCTARELLQPADLTRKKRRGIEDAVAAQVILQGFLDDLRGSTAGPSTPPTDA